MPKGIYERTPAMRAKWAENMRRVRISNGWPKTAHGNGGRASGGDPTAWPRWRSTNPERAEQANTNAGRASSAIPWRCDECGRVIHGPSVGKHQRATGHQGRTRLDSNTQTEEKQ